MYMFLEANVEDNGKLKRLAMNIPADIHASIKIACAKRHITITKWVMRAIIEKLIHERKLDLSE
jgi:hypothetical protein